MHTWTKTRIAGLAVATLVAAGAAVAWATNGTSRTNHIALSRQMATNDQKAERGEMVAGAALDAGAPSVAAPSIVAPPRVVKTGSLRIEVARGGFARAFAEATRIAASRGGFVTASHVDRNRGTVGSLTIRVPADAFEATRNQLAGLGDVRAEEVTGEDVGGRLVDLDARLRSLQVQEAALRSIMAKAGTIADTLQVQQQLTAVRTQIEQLSSEKARLDDAAAMSTISVEVAESGAAAKTATADDGNGLGHSVRVALHGSVAVLGGTLVVLGYALPIALVLGLGWLGGRLVLAGWRRRRPAVA